MMMRVDDEVSKPDRGQSFDRMLEDRTPAYLDHRLRNVLGQRPQTPPLPGRQDECAHSDGIGRGGGEASPSAMNPKTTNFTHQFLDEASQVIAGLNIEAIG